MYPWGDEVTNHKGQWWCRQRFEVWVGPSGGGSDGASTAATGGAYVATPAAQPTTSSTPPPVGTTRTRPSAQVQACTSSCAPPWPTVTGCLPWRRWRCTSRFAIWVGPSGGGGNSVQGVRGQCAARGHAAAGQGLGEVGITGASNRAGRGAGGQADSGGRGRAGGRAPDVTILRHTLHPTRQPLGCGHSAAAAAAH